MNHLVFNCVKEDNTIIRYGVFKSFVILGTVMLYSLSDDKVTTFAWFRDDENRWVVSAEVDLDMPAYKSICATSYDYTMHRLSFKPLPVHGEVNATLESTLRSQL